ncbi:MAG: aminotransferase class III-fold pyridoxal phosphate-dependent enzyme [Nitrospira sp.]|nr:aminotransferase class III-fold pyridoxal phosphate-dependent enzyme [Nitrospira sp.]MCP9443022.1 aminotransferase class III-fold pyridoxal phosphate-dependent enzyme [Nitrospira sp.]
MFGESHEHEFYERWSACVGLSLSSACETDKMGWPEAAVTIGIGLLIVWFVLLLAKLRRALAILRARSFAPEISRLLAPWVATHDYSQETFFTADGADQATASKRRRALDRLADHFQERHSRSIAWANEVREGLSDLRFTDAGRVPFPFARLMRDKFNLCSVVTASQGPMLQDLDGNWSLDVSGSYGVNVAGYDQYKEWIERGWERVKDLGPVLGPLHPVVAENIAMLKSISKLDEVSFHMSGTEAVMAAIRLARFNTGRKFIVCFAGAYHGWWDGVQPGLGSEREIKDCITLKDCHPASLHAIRLMRKDIAAVIVNPIQSFHPNSPPPSDAVLLTSDIRKTEEAHEPYARWLRQLRDVCTTCKIPLIFDEVYSGFRLAPGGAQEYFGVQADLVVYGKTVGGGLPVGVCCGTQDLMRRFDPDHPMRVAYVIGTFSAHPHVMGAMNEFLRWATAPQARQRYAEANERCAAWAASVNKEFAERSLPLRVVTLSTVWTILFQRPGRYNWLLQYYLRAEGVTLSWVGTGRCLSNMAFRSEHYDALQDHVIAAASRMAADGWWPEELDQPERRNAMKSRLIWEMIGSIVQIPKPLRTFYAEVMRRKHDDHVASHSHPLNQLLHLLSSSVFIYCYVLIFTDLATAVTASLAALFVRQFGHAVIEPPCHDKEELLLGFNTPNKTMIVTAYCAIPIANMLGADAWSWSALLDKWPAIAQQWWGLTLVVVLGRVAYLAWLHDVRTSMIWFVKLVTDPFTDIKAYLPRSAGGWRAFFPPYTTNQTSPKS